MQKQDLCSFLDGLASCYQIQCIFSSKSRQNWTQRIIILGDDRIVEDIRIWEMSANSNGVVRSGSLGGDFYDFACKVMLIGDSGVGKTCLLVRFKDGAFLSGSFISTVGIDFRNKVVDIDGSKVKLQIWDTAGQERFRSVTHAYYRDAHALLLLFDVANRQSFDNIRAWVSEIHEYASDDVVVMLLGNKADMTSERLIKKEEAEKLAKDNGIPYMETSAKTGLNVDLSFMAVAKDLKMKKTRRPNEPRFNVREFVDQQKQTPSGCCF